MPLTFELDIEVSSWTTTWNI